MKHAAKSGAEIRGDSSYQVGDFTSGTAKAAGSYASENRCRLAGAGGSALGMVAGAALLGPVGFVAGSLAGGAAAKSSMAALTGDPKKQHPSSEETQRQTSPSNNSQSTSQAPDLLSSDIQQPVAYASAPPRQNAQHPHAQPLQRIRERTDAGQYPAHPPHHQSSRPVPTTGHRGTDGTHSHEGYRFGELVHRPAQIGELARIFC